MSRRLLLAAAAAAPLAWLAGCASPLPLDAPPPAGGDADADRLLQASAEAHGLAAFRQLADINVRYRGTWRPLVDRVQPVLVDKGHRGGSEERLMPAAGLVAQAHSGPAGMKQVVWRRGDGAPARPSTVAVWFDGRPSADADVLDTAALVAEGYGLFLLGPLWLHGRGLAARRDGTEQVDGRACDVVQVWLRPGLGRVALDRIALCIDRQSLLMRRVRFTLEGHAATRGAVAQVDAFDHLQRFGVTWPTRWYEEVLRPISLPAHDWRLDGLDVNRGYDAAVLSGAAFGGAAAVAAAPL